MTEQFGSCPVCGAEGQHYRNIYKQHFFFCEEHRMVWSIGCDLFSSWRHEDEGDWRAAWEKLKDYRACREAPLDAPEWGPTVGPPLSEVTSFEELMPPE